VDVLPISGTTHTVSFLAVPWCYQSRNQGDLPGFCHRYMTSVAAFLMIRNSEAVIGGTRKFFSENCPIDT
jgi:hypothetical protein